MSRYSFRRKRIIYRCGCVATQISMAHVGEGTWMNPVPGAKHHHVEEWWVITRFCNGHDPGT